LTPQSIVITIQLPAENNGNIIKQRISLFSLICVVMRSRNDEMNNGTLCMLLLVAVEKTFNNTRIETTDIV